MFQLGAPQSELDVMETQLLPGCSSSTPKISFRLLLWPQQTTPGACWLNLVPPGDPFPLSDPVEGKDSQVLTIEKPIHENPSMHLDLPQLPTLQQLCDMRAERRPSLGFPQPSHRREAQQTVDRRAKFSPSSWSMGNPKQAQSAIKMRSVYLSRSIPGPVCFLSSK